jgi:serine/threonine protein kinase
MDMEGNLQVTENLSPDYQVIRRISSGEIADVYEAVEARLSRRVALKLLHPAKSQDPEAVERFLLEARTTARLEQHPHTTCVYNIGHQKGLRYFTLRFAQGGTLRQRLEEHGRLPYQKAVDIAKQALEALHFIHTQGFTHGNLQPDNLLFDEGDALVVIDFGNARRINESQKPDSVRAMQQSDYMSPEELAGDTITPSSDLYSLGVVFYEMLMGELPATTASQHGNLETRLGEQVEISRKLAELPAELFSLISRLLQHDPTLRPGSAREALELLNAMESFKPAIIQPLSLLCPEGQAFKIWSEGNQDGIPTVTDGQAVRPLEQTNQLSEWADRSDVSILKRRKPMRWFAAVAVSVLSGIALAKIQNLLIAPAPNALSLNASANNANSRNQSTDIYFPASSVNVGSRAVNGGTEVALAKDADVRKDDAPIAVQCAADCPPDMKKTNSRPSEINNRSQVKSYTSSLVRNDKEEENRSSAFTAIEDHTLLDADSKINDSYSSNYPISRKSLSSAAAPAIPTRANTSKGGGTFLVEHDHVAGECRGKLILRPESLEYISEKEKDSRQWSYEQISKLKRKGSDQLEFSAAEKDLKKLGLLPRNYRFRFLNSPLTPETYEFILARTAH